MLGMGLIALVFLAAVGVALYSLIAGPTIGPVTKMCTQMGCIDNVLRVSLTGDIPKRFTIKVAGTLGVTTTIDCPGDYQYSENKECREDGALFMYDPLSPPEEATISVIWEDNVKTETVKPTCSIARPNGPDCEPECLTGHVTIELP
jgi:hypothetical protein